MFNVFENPWGLVTIAGVAAIVLLIMRSFAPRKYRWWLWLVPVVLALAGFGLDRLVETDLEKVNSVISTVVKAAENEDADTIEQLISDDYRDSYHLTKGALMGRGRSLMSEPLFGKNIARIASIELNPPNATVTFTVRVLFDPQSYVYQAYKQQLLAEVQADLRKQADNNWLISRMELLKIDFRPVNWQYTEQANR
ncbi:MAG: hypothetical protein JW947_00125 [Sedimentisphaerales bacterium]|nr:hypothetical protein [Sedimentisphaerales bacterium]